MFFNEQSFYTHTPHTHTHTHTQRMHQTTYFHDESAVWNYRILYSLKVLSTFHVYILSLNWMASSHDDTGCSANISGSENCVKELTYVLIKALLIVNYGIEEEYTNLLVLSLRNLAIWNPTFVLTSRCLIIFPFPSSTFSLFFSFFYFFLLHLFHLYLTLF